MNQSNYVEPDNNFMALSGEQVSVVLGGLVRMSYWRGDGLIGYVQL